MENKDLLDYPKPIVSVDVVLFTLIEKELTVLLPKRINEPFFGVRALPGGYAHIQEDQDLLDTARRVLREKASLNEGYFIEQLATFSGPARDPRGWSLSVTYYAVIPRSAILERMLGDFILVKEIRGLPFDHSQIIESAIERLRGKSSYSSLPAFLLPKEFSLKELQEMYETVMEIKLDTSSFRRKITELQLVQPIPDKTRQDGGFRLSQLYCLQTPVLRQFQKVI